MKSLIALLFISPLFASAQDTCSVKKQTDPFTHQTKATTGFVPFTVNGLKLSISVDATPTEIDFFIWLTGSQKCFDDASTIQVNYEGDRLKANFKNTGSMNCEGAFHFSFRNTVATPSNLQRLADKNVASFKIANGKEVTEIAFTPEQRIQFRRMAACVLKEAKSLPR